MKRVNVEGVGMIPQFTMIDIMDLGEGRVGNTRYWFEAAMVSTCAPLFDDCDSNYEVERKLEKAKVLTQACISDTESSALVVNFARKDTAISFIARLNKYLLKKAQKLKEAREL